MARPKGIPHTAETKKILSKLMTGFKHTEETKMKISAIRKAISSQFCPQGHDSVEELQDAMDYLYERTKKEVSVTPVHLPCGDVVQE